jgi:5-methyltetrahydrofolate--homocysteine methyltransferase
MFSYDALAEGIMKGDLSVVESEVSKALNGGVEARDILVNGLIGAMSVVSRRFTAGEMFLPEVFMSAHAMRKGLAIIQPLLGKSGQKAVGRVVIGTVEEDIHDIGRRIVSFLLEGNGFEVIDLGVDVKAEVFAQAVEKNQPDILGMSALLTTTMPNMGKTIDFLKQKGLRNKVKIIIGGAAVNESFAKFIGADGYASDAGAGVELMKKWVAN